MTTNPPTYRSTRIEAGRYNITRNDGYTAASITRTGRPGVDDYPWEWAIYDPRFSGWFGPRKNSGQTDTKANAVDHIITALTQADLEGDHHQ